MRKKWEKAEIPVFDTNWEVVALVTKASAEKVVQRVLGRVTALQIKNPKTGQWGFIGVGRMVDPERDKVLP